MKRFTNGEKAVWWNGPGHQSRAEVTILDYWPDEKEYTVETPSHMFERYAYVHESELEELV